MSDDANIRLLQERRLREQLPLSDSEPSDTPEADLSPFDRFMKGMAVAGMMPRAGAIAQAMSMVPEGAHYKIVTVLTPTGWIAFPVIISELKKVVEELTEEERSQLEKEKLERQHQAWLRAMEETQEKIQKELLAAGFIHGGAGDLFGPDNLTQLFLDIEQAITFERENEFMKDRAPTIAEVEAALAMEQAMAVMRVPPVLEAVHVVVPILEAEPELTIRKLAPEIPTEVEDVLRKMPVVQPVEEDEMTRLMKGIFYRKVEGMIWDYVVGKVVKAEPEEDDREPEHETKLAQDKRRDRKPRGSGLDLEVA